MKALLPLPSFCPRCLSRLPCSLALPLLISFLPPATSTAPLCSAETNSRRDAASETEERQRKAVDGQGKAVNGDAPHAAVDGDGVVVVVAELDEAGGHQRVHLGGVGVDRDLRTTMTRTGCNDWTLRTLRDGCQQSSQAGAAAHLSEHESSPRRGRKRQNPSRTLTRGRTE